MDEKKTASNELQISDLIKLHKEASDNFSHALKLNPQFARLHYRRGTEKYQSIQYTEAIKDFNKIMGLQSLYSQAYYYRNMIRSRLKEVLAV